VEYKKVNLNKVDSTKVVTTGSREDGKGGMGRSLSLNTWSWTAIKKLWCAIVQKSDYRKQ
jgi:hypothetical protein